EKGVAVRHRVDVRVRGRAARGARVNRNHAGLSERATRDERIRVDKGRRRASAWRHNGEAGGGALDDVVRREEQVRVQRHRRRRQHRHNGRRFAGAAADTDADVAAGVDADARVRRDVGEDQVAKLAARALAQAHHRVGRARREGARAHEGHAVKGRVRARRAPIPRVHLTAVVAHSAEHREEELALAHVAVVRVEGVVAREEHRQVLDVHRAAEELEAVVEVEGHLAVRDRRAGADAAEGDAVDLVVCAHDRAAVPHAHVLQGARRLGRVGAAVRVAGDALDLRGGRHVGRRVAEQDEAAPLAALAERDGVLIRVRGGGGRAHERRLCKHGRERDRHRRRARRHELAALHDHERRSGAAGGHGQRKDGGASGDREGRRYDDLGGENVRGACGEGRAGSVRARQQGDI
ncbi:hypothetical protein Ctob_016657, partial [Chrysochromulina tobinii]